MVKNREELIQVARNNANQLKTNLRRSIMQFLDAQHVTPEELAYVLGITNEEMRQIIEGDGNITVDALSKLLVATDMAVEIKPVRNTPLGGYGRKMPRSGAYPGPGGIPVDENGRPLPPPPGFPVPPFMKQKQRRDEVEVTMETNGPARDSRGRFAKKSNRPTATQQPQDVPRTFDNPYINIPDAELANIIRQNIWDGEININEASHEQLAEFVANKERIMRERTENHTRNTEENRPEEKNANVGGGGSALNQFLDMLGNVAREAQHNPELMNVIERFMPKK